MEEDKTSIGEIELREMTIDEIIKLYDESLVESNEEYETFKKAIDILLRQSLDLVGEIYEYKNRVQTNPYGVKKEFESVEELIGTIRSLCSEANFYSNTVTYDRERLMELRNLIDELSKRDLGYYNFEIRVLLGMYDQKFRLINDYLGSSDEKERQDCLDQFAVMYEMIEETRMGLGIGENRKKLVDENEEELLEYDGKSLYQAIKNTDEYTSLAKENFDALSNLSSETYSYVINKKSIMSSELRKSIFTKLAVQLLHGPELASEYQEYRDEYKRALDEIKRDEKLIALISSKIEALQSREIGRFNGELFELIGLIRKRETLVLNNLNKLGNVLTIKSNGFNTYEPDSIDEERNELNQKIQEKLLQLGLN